ncbi:MAG: hypothetical protein JWM16_5945 [Verrucomicrobiales bacterium]|nr:hypothetical protein [Verrucomicrobiales bacterium]
MGRIQNGYEVKMRALLTRVRPRRLEAGVQNLLGKAQRLQEETGLPEPHALEKVYHQLQHQLNRWGQVKELAQQTVSFRDALPPEPFFLCDSGLGGLTRWLRAAGYEADWIPDVDDSVLIQEAQRREAILVTTDSMMMERRILRDGIVPALWVPPAFKMHEQLALVLRELRLPLRQPRCMQCGGQLQVVDKESVREKIPPKTYRWLNEFFVCQGCGKLFWHGTHWQRIRGQLGNLSV